MMARPLCQVIALAALTAIQAAATPAWAIDPASARSAVTMQAFDLGLGRGDSVQVLGFSTSETALPPAIVDDLSQRLMDLFPPGLTLRDAKQAGRLAPMLGSNNTIFEDQWQVLTQSDVDALVLFSITKTGAKSATVTVSISNREADQRSVTDIVLPIDRSQAALDLQAVATTQTRDIVSQLKGSGGFAVLPVTSGQNLSNACANTIRQTYLAAFAKSLAAKIEGDLSLRRADADGVKSEEVAVEITSTITPKPTTDVPSLTVTVVLEALGYYSPPALVSAPAACLEDIERVQQPRQRASKNAKPGQAPECQIIIRSMQRVFKVGDELTFQIQPSCDCWPILIDYTDAQGTEVFRPDNIVHRLAFQEPFISAGQTVNVPYSNEPYDEETDTVYDFALTIEPPKRTNTLGVVCAASRNDALNFQPTGLSKASTSRGFGAALKKKITSANSAAAATRYFSNTRLYYVE